MTDTLTTGFKMLGGCAVLFVLPDGVDAAKPRIPSEAAAEQRTKARKKHAVRNPDLEDEFFFLTTLPLSNRAPGEKWTLRYAFKIGAALSLG
jgi:hypothetical protein